MSLANRAYGQEPTVEFGDGRVKIGHGQEPTVDDERSGDSSNDEETLAPPTSTQDTKGEESPSRQQAQPTTTPTTTTPTTTTPTTT
ncbi:MAG TPA: hypothetical protein VI037_00190, partial [Nitrososphaera sp.]